MTIKFRKKLSNVYTCMVISLRADSDMIYFLSYDFKTVLFSSYVCYCSTSIDKWKLMKRNEKKYVIINIHWLLTQMIVINIHIVQLDLYSYFYKQQELLGYICFILLIFISWNLWFILITYITCSFRRSLKLYIKTGLFMHSYCNHLKFN